MTTLEGAALTSVAGSAAALAWMAAQAWRRPVPRAGAAPVGSPWTGIFYAFGAGMSPRAKESASQHPLIYAAGIAYHLGVFSGAAMLALLLGRATVPARLTAVLGILMAVGAAAGLVLLARRATTPLLRAISAPDDYASNLLVDAWLLAGTLAVFSSSVAAFLVATIVLAVYAPLGKIRHCVFFFLARGLYGARLGRRGIVRTAWHGNHS